MRYMFLASATHAQPQGERQAGPASVLGEIRQLLATRYEKADFDPRSLSVGSLTDHGSDPTALVQSLNDPAVRLLNVPEAQNFLIQMTSGLWSGIGLIELLCIVPAQDGRLTVVTPVPGTPAARADIRTGDVIVEIDGKVASDLSLHQAAVALQGERGSKVTVVIDRGGHTLKKAMRRAEFSSDAPLVSARAVTVRGKSVGYLGILRFASGVGAKAAEALAELRKQRIVALVLDLRNNPGGAMAEAITVAGLFLPNNTPIAGLSARGLNAETLTSKGDSAYDGPLRVLQNAGSASAAEMVAGALRAAGRASLVGERSFGKGLVHTMEKLSDQSVLMMPIGRLITPDGADILAQGIAPDEVVADTAHQ
jgi:carboxyl-terminal processing protease